MASTLTTTTTTSPTVAAATAALTRAKAAVAGSPSWEELLGSKNWEGLVEPDLNLSLREFILRCGDFCQATYDAFNSTAESPNCGNSNYGKANFFQDVILKDASRYQVVSFIYATAGIGTDFDKNLFLHPSSAASNPWDEESNWFGYVAVTNDKVSRALGRREVYVAWRGTIMTAEWGSNIFGANPVPATPLLSSSAANNSSSGGFLWWGKQEPKVHDGWLSIYTSQNSLSSYVKSSARVQLHTAIEEIRKKYKDEKLSIVVTGHSLGGSLATLSGFDLAENNVAGGADEVLISVFGFGCPQVGNEAFKDRVDALPNLKILHVNNIRDGVPKLPDSLLSVYVPIQTAELEIDTKKSQYLQSKALTDIFGDFHNLQANLHVVAGWNGMGGAFEMKVNRSLALVNKSCRFLKADLKVPEYWWVERNKGMEYNEATDEWIFDPPPPADQMVNLSLS